MVISKSTGRANQNHYASIFAVIVVAMGWCLVDSAGATIISIDDFNTGELSLSSSNYSTDYQTESSLPPNSVIEGYRKSELTSSITTSPVTITSGTGRAYINQPGGHYRNWIYFTYNNGQSSFPSTGLNLDLSQVVEFTLDVSQLASTTSAQLLLYNSNGNTSVATKTLSSPGSLKFLPADFTGGVFPTVHTVQLHLSNTMRPEYAGSSSINALYVEVVPEPAALGLLGSGLILLIGRRRRNR